MLKKKIKYTDFNGDEREEDFYFNLSKAEIMEMELGKAGGFEAYVRRIINASDNASLVKIFKELILQSVGEKSDDGKRFIKSKEISDAFEQTEAYSNLFIELASNTEAASAFVNGIVPRDVSEKAKELQDKEDKEHKIVPIKSN